VWKKIGNAPVHSSRKTICANFNRKHSGSTFQTRPLLRNPELFGLFGFVLKGIALRISADSHSLGDRAARPQPGCRVIHPALPWGNPIHGPRLRDSSARLIGPRRVLRDGCRVSRTSRLRTQCSDSMAAQARHRPRAAEAAAAAAAAAR
jgi:hypothetical protein